MRSERVSFLVGALLVSAPAFAWAQAPAPAARLDVDAQPSCSTRDELIARVAARSTRIRFVSDGDGVPTMTARIEQGSKGTVVAELTVVEPDGRRFARRLEAPSCAAATDALALVVAITLDPSATTAEAPPTVTATSPARPPAATAPETVVAREHPPERTGGETPVPSTSRLIVAAAGEVVMGPAPSVMPGVAVEVQAALDRASIWSPAVILTLAHVWTGTLAEPEGRAAFTLDLVGLDACPVRLVFFGAEARACAAGSLGRLAAQGSNTYDPRSVARPFATAGGAARLTVPVVWRVEVRARFGVGATLWRDAFEFTPDVFHRVASVTLVGDVGVGVRFP